MGGGDFSTEAYEQLRAAYANEQQRQVDDEIKGTHLMGQDYGLETVPVDSPWADKIELWEYPDGKQPREDEKQSPDEILQIMRDSAQERIDGKKEEEEEEVEEEIAEEDLEIDAESESEPDAEDEAEDEEEAEDDINIAEMSDEEVDAYLNSILAQRGNDEDEDEDEDEETEEEDSEVEEVEDSNEPESDEDEEEDEPEEEEAEEPAIDLDDVASQIAELRAELESMQFVSDIQEEPEADDESP